MTACCICHTKETEENNSGFGEFAGDKDKLIQKPVPKDDIKNQATIASKGVEIQNDLEDTKTNQDQRSLIAEDEDKKVQQDERAIKPVLQDVSDNFLTEGIPAFWSDRQQMQNAYSLEAKGWKVQVNWGESSISGAGVGAFVGEDVEKGQLIRVAETGKNLVRFRDQSDLPKNMSMVTKNYISNYCGQVDDFAMIFLPGNCFNHDIDPNIDMIAADEETIHLLAAKDMKAGTELTQNYYTFGKPPKYLEDLAKDQQMDLVFSGYNSFL